MTIDDLLRDAAPSPDRLRSHTDGLRSGVLARATARRRRTRSPLRLGIAAAAVATVGVTGVAYATGSVPALFSSSVEDAGRTLGVPADQVPTLTQIADLTLPDGSRFAAWQADNDAMWCTAYVDNWDGAQPTGNGATACGDETSRDLNRVSIAWAQAADGSTYYPVLFGDADDDVAEVRVSGRFTPTGETVDLTLPVDPATSAYAGVLPGTTDDPWRKLRGSGLEVELLGADGRVLRSAEAPPA
jgi:hypothetical protein